MSITGIVKDSYAWLKVKCLNLSTLIVSSTVFCVYDLMTNSYLLYGNCYWFVVVAIRIILYSGLVLKWKLYFRKLWYKKKKRTQTDINVYL